MKKFFGALIFICVLFVAGYTSYRGYESWKQKHLIRKAHEFIAKSDVVNSLLCLRQVLQSNPYNMEACLMMAEYAELANSPQSLFWRSRVLEIDPTSITNRLALARTAIALGDTEFAEKTLDGVGAADKERALYHKLLATVYAASGRFSEAEIHLLETVRLDPKNQDAQLDLVVLRLQNSDAEKQNQERSVLQSMCTNPLVSCDALRQLTFDALRQQNPQLAFSFSKQLVVESNATFEDRLLHLGLLRASTNAQQEAFLSRLQQEALGSPPKAFNLARVMMETGNIESTLTWIRNLPLTTRTNCPVPVIEANCYVAIKDWATLDTFLSRQNWYDWEFLRLALCSRSAKEQGFQAAATSKWSSAILATGYRRELLIQLFKAASQWQWSQEQEDVLWTIIERYPKERWATEALTQHLFFAGRTQSLLKLYSILLSNDRDNTPLKNNLAMIALLLQSWEKTPHQLALEVYKQAPTNASYISTYAFSLLLQQKTNDALRIIKQLTPEQLHDPATAVYYGLILKAAKDPGSVGEYLDLAKKTKLLPEEEKLVMDARR
jgi:cytochrome c-type biogenesis protein CcmH/NrfG